MITLIKAMYVLVTALAGVLCVVMLAALVLLL